MKRTFVLLFLVLMLFLTQMSYCQSDTTIVLSSDDSTEVISNRRRGKISKSNSLALATKNVVLDTVKKKEHVHNTKLATCLSFIPGAGQIYNHKAWKVPIFYGLLAGASYFVYSYGTKTKSLRNEYVYRMNGNLDMLNPTYENYTDENILGMRNSYRTNLEISVAALAIVYVLNIIDACVDAHLYDFDITDDLSMRLTPSVQQYSFMSTPVTGLSLTFNLK